LSWLKYVVNLGFPLLVAALAVWYIAPTTSGGIIVVSIIVLAACAGVVQSLRWLFGHGKNGLVIPEKQESEDNDSND
jgi:apolipoprotein N-acyltransferase